MAKPTDPQKKLLRELGIDPLPTKAACKAVLSFVLNWTYKDMDKFQKAAYFKSLQQQWVGRRVIIDERCFGKVVYVTCDANFPMHILYERESPIPWQWSPFRYYVASDNGEIKGLKSIEAIQVLNE